MAKKEKTGSEREPAAGAQGSISGGRFYRPPSVAPEDDKAPEPVGPEGRFYVPSADDKDGESLAENPVQQAAVMAGEPPSKDDVKAAKAEAKAVEAGTSEPADPAAETVQPDPIAAAGELAQDGPVPEPKGNASRDDWADYARSKGATDADLVDAEGNPLRREEIRDKYGSN